MIFSSMIMAMYLSLKFCFVAIVIIGRTLISIFCIISSSRCGTVFTIAAWFKTKSTVTVALFMGHWFGILNYFITKIHKVLTRSLTGFLRWQNESFSLLSFQMITTGGGSHKISILASFHRFRFCLIIWSLYTSPSLQQSTINFKYKNIKSSAESRWGWGIRII